MFISDHSQSEQQTRQKLTPTCPQYIVITPADTSEWPQIKKQLQQMAGQRYSTQKMIKFLQNRYLGKKYTNIRLLKRIKTDYFWNGVTRFMIESMIQDTHLIAASINVLLSEQNTILKLTKYQIFIIFCHLFMATFPSQLYDTINNNNMGPFISVMDDQDDITCRLNKLKSIIRYFCLFYKRSEQHPEIKDELVIFQRCGSRRQYMEKQVLKDSIKFCKVHPQIGQFFANQNEINAISINNIRLVEGNRIVDKPIPGLGVYGNQIDYQEKIFFSHPQLLILPLIMYEGLEDYESIIVHGMEKYSTLDAVSKHTMYDFRQKFKDGSQINKLTKLKDTSFIFVKRQIYSRKNKHNIIPDIIKLSYALKACLAIRNPKHKLTSGAFYTTISQLPQKSKSVPKLNLNPQTQIKKKSRIEMPWHMKFLVDWLAASIANFQSIHFYVELQMQAVNLKILAHELKDHTINDVISIIDSYYQFKMQDKGKLTLLDFMKDFAL